MRWTMQGRMKMKRTSKRRRSAVDKFLALSDAERAKAVRKFDTEFVSDSFGPAPARAKALHAKARRLGRPKVGQGVKVVPVSIERGLLAEADRFRKSAKMTRAAMVAMGLRLVMAADKRAKNAVA